MDKRRFLAAALGAAGAPVLAQPAGTPRRPRGPVLLTVTGEVSRTNRGPFDPVRDQMMAKHGLEFSKAREFDFTALTALPAVTIRPTLEYDKQRHTLSGPRLDHVLDLAGVRGDGYTLSMRAIDGYAPTLTLAEARRLGFIVATRMDGRPLALGGLGPLWALYEPDRFPDIAAKPVDQRFAVCPWGLYHIAVQPG